MSEAYSITSNAFTYEHKIFCNEHEDWNHTMALALTSAMVMDLSFKDWTQYSLYSNSYPWLPGNMHTYTCILNTLAALLELKGGLCGGGNRETYG